MKPNRLLTDLEGVAAEYQLRADCLDAARALAEVGATAKVSDNAGRIVAAGAHPFTTWNVNAKQPPRRQDSQEKDREKTARENEKPTL